MVALGRQTAHEMGMRGVLFCTGKNTWRRILKMWGMPCRDVSAATTLTIGRKPPAVLALGAGAISQMCHEGRGDYPPALRTSANIEQYMQRV